MAVTVAHPRGIMLLVFLGVTLLLVGIADGAEYTKKIYMDENCDANLTTDGYLAGEVLLTRGKGCASQQCNCSLRLTHDDTSKRLKVRFTELDLGEDSNRKCIGNIILYSINGDKKKFKGEKCTDPNVRGSEDQADMNVLYFKTILGNYQNPKISMFFTVFHEDNCAKDEFQCSADPIPCVSNTLKCDGYDNCGDKSDEEKETAGCGATGVTSSAYQLSVITLAAIWMMKLVS